VSITSVMLLIVTERCGRHSTEPHKTSAWPAVKQRVQVTGNTANLTHKHPGLAARHIRPTSLPADMPSRPSSQKPRSISVPQCTYRSSTLPAAGSTGCCCSCGDRFASPGYQQLLLCCRRP
jgi:hypothetical protein